MILELIIFMDLNCLYFSTKNIGFQIIYIYIYILGVGEGKCFPFNIVSLFNSQTLELLERFGCWK
jgi:hypothetical protein